MIQDQIHGQIIRHLDEVNAWFKAHRRELDVPFYSSYDIRDSGFKVANVDANIYPAGFNNICLTDREHAGALAKSYIEDHYGTGCRRVLILSEEHTTNPYYWENVRALRTIIADAGLEVEIAFPRLQGGDTVDLKTASGEIVRVHNALIKDGEISVTGFKPDLVISNNDFSEQYPDWGTLLKTPINPPRELGWYQRKKSTYFKYYNELSTEFAKLIDVDPWLMTVETELVSDFDMSEERSRKGLADKVDALLERTRVKYKEHGVDQAPFAFVKNNAGTYGLAVMKVDSGANVMALNNRSRTKMKAAKGGRAVEEVIIQEGLPSIVRADGITAEPAIYLLGCQLAGGFLRTHQEKDPTESLNSPGAVYKRLCTTDLNVSVQGHPLENVYGWTAKLGLLAIGRESASMGVTYNGYK